MNVLRLLEDQGDDFFYIILGLTAILMVMATIVSFLNRHNQIIYSAISILIVSTSCTLYVNNTYGFSLSNTIPRDVVFKFLAPPIVFSAGFNLTEKYFFKNIGFITLYGVLGTIISFVILTTGIFFTNRFLQDYIGAEPSGYSWTIINVLKLCAPLINTESWFARQLLDEGESYPALYSIIF